MEKLKLGVIGAGGIVCRMHLPDLAQDSDFEVSVIGGRREHRLKTSVPRIQHTALDPGLRRNHR